MCIASLAKKLKNNYSQLIGNTFFFNDYFCICLHKWVALLLVCTSGRQVIMWNIMTFIQLWGPVIIPNYVAPNMICLHGWHPPRKVFCAYNGLSGKGDNVTVGEKKCSSLSWQAGWFSLEQRWQIYEFSFIPVMLICWPISARKGLNVWISLIIVWVLMSSKLCSSTDIL